VDTTVTRPIICVIAGLLTLGGCSGPAPVTAKYPTQDTITATDQAIGVPFDRFVLMRDADRYLALRITARSTRGERIHYQWAIAAAQSTGFAGADVQRGEGESVEQQFTGSITLPGIKLAWSRGSAELGWIYWPDDGRAFSVFSRPWRELEDIDTRARAGKWLERSQFRK